jgi:hypothetical protein
MTATRFGRTRFGRWTNSQSLAVRLVVYLGFFAIVLGVFALVLTVLHQNVHWMSLAMMGVVYAVFTAATTRPQRTSDDPLEWMRSRFPRLDGYLRGFQDKPDPRLSRFKPSGADRPSGTPGSGVRSGPGTSES